MKPGIRTRSQSAGTCKPEAPCNACINCTLQKKQPSKKIKNKRIKKNKDGHESDANSEKTSKSESEVLNMQSKETEFNSQIESAKQTVKEHEKIIAGSKVSVGELVNIIEQFTPKNTPVNTPQNSPQKKSSE